MLRPGWCPDATTLSFCHWRRKFRSPSTKVDDRWRRHDSTSEALGLPFWYKHAFSTNSITFQYLFRFLGTAYVCPNFLYSFTWALEIRCFRVYLPTISLFSCFIAHPWELCSQVFCGLIEASRTTCKQWYVSSCSASRYTHHDQYWSMLDILDQRDGFGSNSSTSCFFEPQHFWTLEWCLIHFDHFSIHIWQSLTCSASWRHRNPQNAEELVLSRAEDETEILRSQNKELKEVAKNNESKRWIEVTWFLRDPWMLDDVWFSFVWSLILVRDGEWKRMMDYDGLELHQRWPRMIVRLTYHHHSSSLIDIFRLTLKHPWGR